MSLKLGYCTYVNDEDSPAGLLGLAATVAGRVHISLGNEDVAVWHRYRFGNILYIQVSNGSL